MAEKQKTEQKVSLKQVRELHKMERRKLRQLLERQRLVNQLAFENDNTLAAAKEINNSKETESIIPLGGGIFVNAKLTPHSLKRTLPGNVVVPATIEDVEKDLIERIGILAKEGEFVHKQVIESRTNLQSLTTLMRMAKFERTKTKK